MRVAPALFLLLLLSKIAAAQLSDFPVGQNRSEIDWKEFQTEHFTLIYHTGLETYAREAADVAEAVYPVVTGNLRTPVTHRIPLYLSDLDEIPNAFAHGDDYMHIWMRGILDDMPLGGIRSAGHAKWFRAVITHELTHIVISHATSASLQEWLGMRTVPRWFHEGLARFMEPDGWTSDVDAVLRVAAVNGRLGYDALRPGRLDGTLLYETGHSIVRYMVWRFGDTVIAKILHSGRNGFGYNFESAIRSATGVGLSEIYSDWFRTVTALYGSEYGVREEISEISPPIGDFFEVVSGARYAPARKRLALLGALHGEPTYLYLLTGSDSGKSPLDSVGAVRVLSRNTGFDEQFSWSPDGSQIVLAKLRYGSHRALLHDLYILDVDENDLRPLTSDASVSDPDWSPDGRSIVAVEKRIGRDNLVLVDPRDGTRRRLTSFADDTQIYTPSWSPDGTRIAFSMFDPEGKRVLAVIGADGTGLRRLTDDTVNNRYPLWSPDGTRIAYTSHAGGRPNIHVMDTAGGSRTQATDLGAGVFGVQWIPGSDSILAISFDTRDQIVPHLIPASRRVTPAPAAVIRNRFNAWRSVAFPLQVPPAAQIPNAALLDSGGYSPIAHISPLVAVFPIYGTDIDRAGTEKGSRFGVATVWMDPMQIHTAVAYVDQGLKSHEPGAELLYLYRGLPFTLQFHLAYSLGFSGTVSDVPYYQRDRTLAVTASYDLPDPHTFGIGSIVGIGARHRVLEPFNGQQFARARLDSTLVPEHARLGELLAFYEFGSPQLLYRGEIVRSEPLLGSSMEYTRVTFRLAWRWGSSGAWFLGYPDFLLNVDFGAHFGAQVPQEALAFQAYDQFENGFSIPNLIGLSSNRTNYRPRGIRLFNQGEYLFLVGTSAVWEPEWLGALLPLVGVFEPELVGFAEVGNVQPPDRASLGDASLYNLGLGIELRASILNNYWIAAGYATGISDRRHDGSFDDNRYEHSGAYVRLSVGR
jgi:hypothetical protein